jgi:hypothetical protein
VRRLFYRANAPSGISSVTCTETNGTGEIYVGHVKGLTNHGTLDQNAVTGAGAFTSTPWNSPAVTTTIGAEYLLGTVGGVFNGANCNPSASGSWTMDAHVNDGGTGDTSAYSHQIVSAIQTNIQNTGTDAGTCSHWAGIATFK